MSELSAENLEVDTTQEGHVVIEPGYLGYIRSEGYQIDGIESAHTVPSESGEGSHIVVEVRTYEYPRNSQKLDLTEHALYLKVCDCWSWRQSSNDVSEPGVKPGGTCKHVESAFMSEKAKADDKQQELD